MMVTSTETTLKEIDDRISEAEVDLLFSSTEAEGRQLADLISELKRVRRRLELGLE